MAPPPAMPAAEAIAPVPVTRDSKINRDLLRGASSARASATSGCSR